MEEPLSNYIKLTIELLIAAVLLTFIGRSAFLGNTAANSAYSTRYAEESLESKASLFMYDNKTVTASDAIELMFSKPFEYEYRIEFFDAGGNEIKPSVLRSRSNQNETGQYKDYWSEEALTAIFNGYEHENFISTLEMFDGTDEVKTVVFTYSNTL